MIKRLGIILFVTVLLLSGCQGAATSKPAQEAATNSSSYGIGRDALNGGAQKGAEAPGAAPALATDSRQSSQANAVKRLVIRTADLTIVVEQPAQALDTVSRMAETMGGYVVSSNLYKTSHNNQEVPEARITIRVPAEKLNTAMDQIKRAGWKLRARCAGGKHQR